MQFNYKWTANFVKIRVFIFFVDKLINAFTGIFWGVKKIEAHFEITIENASMNFAQNQKK
jgi:hypothetical protein